jgi:hypothetical protein
VEKEQPAGACPPTRVLKFGLAVAMLVGFAGGLVLNRVYQGGLNLFGWQI